MSDKKISVLDWADDVLKEYIEYEEIAAAEDPQFLKLHELIAKWNNNLFPKTADKDGIALFEQLLNVTPLPNEDLEDRRYRVIAKLNARLPYTEIQLRRILGGILGYDGFTLTVKDLILTLSLTEGNNSKIQIIYELLKEIVPMNILIKLHQFIQRRLSIKVAALTKVGNRIKVYPWSADEIITGTSIKTSGLIKIGTKLLVIPERDLEAHAETNIKTYPFVCLGQRIVVRGDE